MSTKSDPQLLREYAGSRSEAAFAELVRRHIDLVHSAALRITGDAHLAKDVSQGVFVALAKDAGKLAAHPVLSGWLHATTRNIAAQTIRTEARRRKREQQAAAMNDSSETHAAWDEIAPHLDAALSELADSDRDAVLLRYFENQSAKDMAAVLGISPEAAQKRVNRGVEKLRDNFAKRGLTTGTAGLAGAISVNAVQAAPMGLAGAVSSGVLAGAVSVAVGTKVVAVSFLRRIVIVIAVAGAIGFALHQSGRVSKLQRENQTLQQAYIRQAIRSIRPRELAPATLPGNPKSENRDHDKFTGASQVMASVEGSSDSVEFSLIAPAGRGITTGAAEVAGLSLIQKKAVDGVLRATWKRVSNDFASRAVIEKAASEPKAGLLVYNIPARPDRGREFIRQLETSLDAEVGEAKRKVLMKGIGPGDFIGSFGALDIRLKFSKGGQCEYTLSQPESGEHVGKGSMDFDSFIDRFGHSFELPRPNTYPTYH